MDKGNYKNPVTWLEFTEEMYVTVCAGQHWQEAVYN